MSVLFEESMPDSNDDADPESRRTAVLCIHNLYWEGM